MTFWTYLLNYWMYLLPDAMMIVVGWWYWRRSRHPGFALFIAAFVLNLTVTLWTVLVNFSGGFNRLMPSMFLLWQLSPIIVCVLMILGLRLFFITIRPQQTTMERKSVAPTDWARVKQKGVGIIGGGLIVAGIATVIRGVQFMTQYNGQLADLGAGPGAILVGILCVGLSVHPRSPLGKRETPRQPEDL